MRRTTQLFSIIAAALALPLAAQQTAAPQPQPQTYVPGQPVSCPPLNQPLVRIPELVSRNGRLRETVVVTSQQLTMTVRLPVSSTDRAPASNSTSQCYPQWVRAMRGVGAVPLAPKQRDGAMFGDLLPGPTLRARVGDLVELTFLNQIDPNDFGSSVDRGERSPSGGCDENTFYPGKTPQSDKFPDCFHGSTTANIHFHGTHTNPNSTGDNVFIEIRPSLRTKDAANKPVVTQQTVLEPFAQFFEKCEAHLTPNNPLNEWPNTWADLPNGYTAEQERLLKEYDSNPAIGRKLWPVDQRQREQGAWPQYYIGAFPYCFRIPQKTSETTAQVTPSDHSGHSAGMGTGELPPEPEHRLIMGQAPGTHWYHAHKHGSTYIDVANGMTGAFIIEGEYDDYLDSNYKQAGWTRQQPVLVINQFGVTDNLQRGGAGQDKGPDFSVNGRLKPVITMKPGEVQLWRIVNASGRAGVYFSAPPNGFHWKQLAQDGVQFNDANYQASTDMPFFLASGNRADILVQAPPAGSTALVPFTVQNDVDPTDLPTAPPLTLLSVSLAGSKNEMQFPAHAAPFPDFLQDVKDSEIKTHRRVEFKSMRNPGTPTAPVAHMIDNKLFDGEVGEVVLLNTAEEWKVINTAETSPGQAGGPSISHPFHIHINPFQVTEVFAPNEPLMDANGRVAVDSAGKQVVDPKTNAPANHYYFTPGGKLAAGQTLLPGQCVLDSDGNEETWKPCGANLAAAPNHPSTVSPIWWDTFPIPSRAIAINSAGAKVTVPGWFKMRSRFVDYPGYYVIHCHILAHEDRGMMTIVEVAPLRSPYSHH